jgi:hypothetical protein
VIIFIAICMTVLIGFTGLATDTGMIWITRSRLQNSVDAGALAAAQELPSNSSAQVVACEYATVLNAVPGMTGADCGGKADIVFPEADFTEITVTAHRTVQPFFGQIVGFDPVEVSAQATARIGSLGSTCLFPLFLTTDQINPDDTEFFVPVKFSEANTAVDVGNGSQAVEDAMEDQVCEGDGGSPTSISGGIGSEVDIKTGSATQFEAGWEAIRDKALLPSSACPNPNISTYTTVNASGQTELLPSITIENCPRLIVVPVLPPGNYNGNATGVIQAFVPFYFSNVCEDNNGCTVTGIATEVENHKAWGYFVHLDLTSLSYSDYQPELGTKIVSLAS